MSGSSILSKSEKMWSLKKKIIKRNYIEQNKERNKDIKRLINNWSIKRREWKWNYYKKIGIWTEEKRKRQTWIYRNYWFRKKLEEQRERKRNRKNLKENRIEIILMKSNWVKSIEEAERWVKQKKVIIERKEVKKGDIIIAKKEILPIIYKNMWIHRKYGQKVPKGIERRVEKIYINKTELSHKMSI